LFGQNYLSTVSVRIQNMYIQIVEHDPKKERRKERKKEKKNVKH